MTTTPFRELPPPLAMTLSHSSEKSRSVLGQSQLSQSMGHLPDIPLQWQESEDTMGNWLLAKAEEDKLRQEEEKTRQEALKLEQRKVEQDMLNTSLREGIPPFLIPMFFAGISGGSSPTTCTEMFQNQLAQVHQQQQQHQNSLQKSQLSAQAPITTNQLYQTDTRSNQLYQTDTRSNQQYTGSVLRPLTSNSCSKQMTINGSHLCPKVAKSYQISPASTPRSYQMSQSKAVKLSRLSGEGINFDSIVTASGIQNTSEKQSSPPIHFHYWQPPTTQTEKCCVHQSTNSLGKCKTSSIFTLFQPSSDNDSPPKKRKTLKNQLPAPLPTHQQQQQQQRYSTNFSKLNTSILNPPITRQPSNTKQIGYSLGRELSDYSEPINNQCNIEKSSHEKISSLPNQAKTSTSKKTQLDSLVQSSHSVSNLLEILEPTRENCQI
ncbi:hypothetical protein EV44_g1955 [Erysiphe necator]|uniref:Uncharacterized protein n=1 Tax=Uncinula necator TaxID=52586 RepID=A0A0B1P403_UNCNE|nr:hypothetical protein EV44_g1955 [Erysiphe necator]